MFGLFDSPRLKAQRHAAKSARSGRELVGREVAVELQMLAKRIAWASGQRDVAVSQGRNDVAERIAASMMEGQAIFDRLNYAVDPILSENQEKWRAANSADDFEALATYEHELRDALIQVRDEAKLRLNEIGASAIEVSLQRV